MTHHIPALARTHLHRCMQIFKPVGCMQFALLTLTGLISAATYANDDVAGFWASGDSVLHISVKDQSLSAVVVAMLDPVYREDEEFGPAGAPRRDNNNPDASLRDQLILGMELLQDYSFTGKRWEGKIYDPASGNTYSSRMHVDGSGNLNMRGYIGVPMLGRTEEFEPLSLCKPHMQAILARTPEFETQLCSATTN